MTPEQLLKLSSKAGRILLESGAEIQRTEDTICRLCQSFGVEEASAFVIPTGMFLSLSYQGSTYSKILRIRSSSLNLEKINLVNDLSRRCVCEPIKIEEALDELDRIEATSGYCGLPAEPLPRSSHCFSAEPFRMPFSLFSSAA